MLTGTSSVTNPPLNDTVNNQFFIKKRSAYKGRKPKLSQEQVVTLKAHVAVGAKKAEMAR